ncbi:MAG: site-specific integrase [Thermodesulfobacteriota bacterium]
MSVRKRGKNRWQIRFTPPRGDRVEITVKARNRREAEQLEMEVKMELQRKDLGLKSIRLTFGELSEKYARGIKDRSVLYRLNILTKYFGKEKVSSISKGEIIDCIEYLKQERGVKPATANRYIAVMSRMWNWYGISPNPCEGIDRECEEERLRYLEIDEIERLVKCFGYPYRWIVELAVYSGLRKGNIIDLRRDWVDGKDMVFRIPKASHKSRKFLEIPYTERVQTILNDIPLSIDGRYFHVADIRKVWYKGLNKAGLYKLNDPERLRDFRFHDLRHTFATHMWKAGFRLDQIMVMLGVSDISVVQRYAHVHRDMRSRMVIQADKYFKDSAFSR